MDFSFSEHQDAISKNTKAFALVEIAPFQEKLENDNDFRQQLFQKMAKKGLFLQTVSKEFGGYFSDTLSYLLALKEIAKIDAGISVAMAVTNMVAELIAKEGSQQQKSHYLPLIANGKCVPLSFASTEKNAGSDAKNIETVAQYENDCIVLSGEKQFITNGDISGAILVFAKSSKGITAYLVDRDTKGLSVLKKERKLGLLSAHLVTLQFDQCKIPLNRQLGEEGQGFKIALRALDSGRLGIAVQALGIAEAAYEAARTFAKQRVQFGHPIAAFQAISFKLADMHVKLNAGFLLLSKAAWLKDKGEAFTLAASEAKLFCTEAANEIAADALQIHGGYGYTKDYPAERYFRDARVTTLYEGTSEIQRLIISRAILEYS